MATNNHRVSLVLGRSFYAYFVFEKGVMQMWKVFLLRFDGLVIGSVSVLYGCRLLANPEIMNQYKTYEVIGGMFNSPILAYMFILFGILKIIGVVINNQNLKVTAIFGLFFLWTMFSVSFFIVDIYYHFPTSLGLLCLIPTFFAGKVALKEV